MDIATQWSVDRLAASSLLARLQLDATDELLDMIARQFAEHRLAMASWAAERTQSAMIEAMEAASSAYFAHRSEEWIRGFCQAEEILCAVQPDRMLDLDPGPQRSKGQILRAMMRQARRS